MIEKVLSQVQTAEMRFFRRVYVVTLRGKVCICEIRETLNVEQLLMEKSLLYLLDHVTRISQKSLAIRILLATHTEKQLRGRPRTRWRDCISGLVWPPYGVKSTEPAEIAKNREISSPSGTTASRRKEGVNMSENE